MYQKTQSYEVRFLICGVRQTESVVILGQFFNCYLQTTRKIKIFKKWKKHLEMSSFYTYALKITIKWCMLPEIWSVKDIFFCHFGPFLALSSQLLTPKIKIWKNVKKTWRCYAFTHVYHKWRSYDVWFLRYKAEFFVILGHFLPFDPPNSPKNQNFEKNEKQKKTPGDITILHMCFINENHMMYGSWDKERDRQNFFLLRTFFFVYLPPNNPENQNFEKWKKRVEISFTQVYHKWQSYDAWFLRYLSFWVIFCSFTPLTTQKVKILKKWKKQLDISSFYTGIPNIMIVCYTVPEIWHVTSVIAIFHFGLLLALLPP